MMESKVESLKAEVEQFLNGIDVSPNTARTYQEALKSFFNWLGEKGEINSTDIRAYKEWLRGHRTANTVSTYIVALRRFFGYCAGEGLLPANPAQNIKGVKRPREHLRQDLSRAEIRAVFNSIDRSTEVGKRDFAIVNLMVRNGLRIIEIQRANVGDLETRQGRKILRVMGKGRDEKDEFVVLTEPTEQAISDYLNARDGIEGDAPLFVGCGGSNRGRRLTQRSIRRQVTKYLVKAGVKTEKVSPHSLRHSFVTLAIEGGASLEKVQSAARHRSITTTRVYFHEHDRLESPVEDTIEI